MPYFVVSYDLHKTRDYERVHKGIVDVSNNVWAKLLESFYIIHSNYDSIYVSNFLKNYIDKDDSLVVIITDLKDWSVINVDLRALEWLKGETK